MSHSLAKRVDDLSREVATLRALVISVVRLSDPEGRYKPNFAKAVLKAAKETPTLEYTGKGSLLNQLKQLK